MSRPRLRAEDLGAWLVKANPAGGPIAEQLAAGLASVATRCVQRSYRTDLVQPGQPVLLWVSGSRRDLPAGIHGHGTVTGPCHELDGSLVMPVRLRTLHEPLLRADLLPDPVLGRLEVLVQPQGSNPSFIDRGQWAALLARAPELGRGWSGVSPG